MLGDLRKPFGLPEILSASEACRETGLPDAHYLIASVKNGKVAYVKSFAWDPGKKDFLEEPVEVV